MKKILPKVLAIFLVAAMISCASSKKSNAKEEPLSVTTQDNKKNTTDVAEAPVIGPDEDAEVAPTYIDSGIEKINEPGMMVVDETDGLSDSLSTADKPIQLHEIDGNEAADEAKINAEVDKWKKTHNAILSKSADSITSNDLGLIQKAISDYNNLSDGAKAKLQSEYKDLQNKLAKAKALAEAEAKAAADAKSKAAAEAKKTADAKAKAAAEAKAKADADAKKAADAKIDAEVAKWKQTHNAILSKNANSITSNDLSAIQKAISDYNSLSTGAKNKLQKEYKDLQNKLAKAKAAAEAEAKAKSEEKAKDAGNTLSVADSGNNSKVATNTQPRGHVVLDNAQYYTVRRGDRLILIAKRFYGSEKGNYFPFIIAGTEEKIEDPDLIEVGQKLTIPDLKAAVSTEESKNYVKQTFYDVADKYDAKGKPGMAAQLRAIAAEL
ncbi:MAG: LysM peptidoglycan-binding domain-containing protein [Treponemataceae bacterium]|nr:LysM peptidoglycan-binding domain-containing protein [Treponemataceae bacterium]